MVEDYLDAHLRTPDLPKDDIARALGARGWALEGRRAEILAGGLSRSITLLYCDQDVDCVLSSHSFTS